MKASRESSPIDENKYAIKPKQTLHELDCPEQSIAFLAFKNPRHPNVDDAGRVGGVGRGHI